MPKATSTSPSPPARTAAAPFQNAQVLRRNQACHQCRRRKLKCDAKRPCSTCVRSHAYAVAHAAPGSDIPPHPECTFDEVSEPSVVDSQESPKNRFERLENRITELEALLKEKDQALSSTDSLVSSRHSPAVTSYKASSLFLGYADNYHIPDVSLSLETHLNRLDMGHFSNGSPLDDLAGVAALLGSPNQLPYTPSDTTNSAFDPSSPTPTFEIINPAWPRNLPNYSVLRHLVEAFFNFAPFSGRMFHAPTFIASLSLPPTHPKFPFPAILHAMCALGSMYTAAVSSSPGGRGYGVVTDTFGDTQIRAAKDALETSLRHTVDLFGSFQAYIIIALWYWYNARWSEACVSFSISLRYAIPCGLNVCPPFEGISSSNMGRSSLISPASNVVEDEMRRNTFWIGYMVERQFAAINNFAMFLDDQDVCQMLPVRGDQFDQGILVPPQDRQWSHEPDVVVQHIEDQVDSFTLHVKSTMLLSRVKTFNTRYRAKRHLGHPSMMPELSVTGVPHQPNIMLTVPAFVELDKLIEEFQELLPSHLKDPMANGVIDASLLTAISNSHFAMIILHEGHANIGKNSCISSCKILKSARAILQLLYEAYSTSHNLALLGVFPMVCWFAAGRVLARFLRAAIENKSEEHITDLQIEVDFIRSVITGIGDSVPHAHHYGKMLGDYVAATCGKEYAQPIAKPSLSRSNTPEELLEEQLHTLDTTAGQ